MLLLVVIDIELIIFDNRRKGNKSAAVKADLLPERSNYAVSQTEE